MSTVRLFQWATAFAVAAGAVQGCIYDPDDRCGPGQRLVDEQCLCPEGLVLNELGTDCVPCGPNEVAAGNTCACAPGFARQNEDAPCAPLPNELGRVCDPDTDPCEQATYDYCAEPASGEPYCTKRGCSSHADCDGDYGCELDASPTFCSKPPTGQGTPCESPSDCAGFEANFCELYTSRVCLVENCASADVKCHRDWVCCDYAVYRLGSICIPPSSLENGACPVGGALVRE